MSESLGARLRQRHYASGRTNGDRFTSFGRDSPRSVAAATDYGRKADETPEPSRADFTFFAELDAGGILARISLTSTIDRERGVTHFVAQAIVREVAPGAVRWRPQP